MKNFIKKTTNFILSHFIGVTDFPERVTDTSIRQKYALRSLDKHHWEPLLAGIKVFFGIILNSISLLADALIQPQSTYIHCSIIRIQDFKFSCR